MFTGENKPVSLSNKFIWFKKWVIKRRTIEDLSKESGYSQRTLKRLFNKYLSKPPKLSLATARLHRVVYIKKHYICIYE